MNKQVDNLVYLRITGVVLWIVLWMAKLRELISYRVLRGRRISSRNTCTAKGGAAPGVTSGDAGGAGKPGNRAAAWPGVVGRRYRVGQATGRPMRLRPDKAPSISYMEGALLYLARRGRVDNADTPGGAKMSAWVNQFLVSGGQVRRFPPSPGRPGSWPGAAGSGSGPAAGRRCRPGCREVRSPAPSLGRRAWVLLRSPQKFSQKKRWWRRVVALLPTGARGTQGGAGIWSPGNSHDPGTVRQLAWGGRLARGSRGRRWPTRRGGAADGRAGRYRASSAGARTRDRRWLRMLSGSAVGPGGTGRGVRPGFSAEARPHRVVGSGDETGLPPPWDVVEAGIHRVGGLSAAARRAANWAAMASSVQCAFRPLGLGTTQAWAPASGSGWGPTVACRWPNAVR